MKAFEPYSKEERNLRILCRRLQDYGKVQCTFKQFNEIYCEWHLKAFKGCPVSTTTATFRNDWFLDFVNFLANYEIDEPKTNEWYKKEL